MAYGHDKVTEVAGYQLAELIGSGGMGEVYKAYNYSLNRFAAVKILHQPSYAARFANEATIQSSVNHPNIARLYEFTSCGDKQCIVMEYVEGESLDQLLKRKGKLSNEEAENIIRQIVSALIYLHERDIIHRDIKPQNFKVIADGTVKMLDFGIAKHKLSPKFTQAGFIVGTTEYLAPEQFQQAAELKSDIWALGVMAYELITGYMPFETANPVILQAKIRKGVYTIPGLLVPGISEKMSSVIDKSLKVNPGSRNTAAGIEAILGKQKQGIKGAGFPTFGLLADPQKFGVPVAIIVAVLLFLIYLINREADVTPGASQIVPATEQTGYKKAVNAGSENKMIINTPGISDAEIILPDGAHQPLPYTVSGREGEKFEFIIRANGYADKEVEVVLTPRRISYEFNLDKK